MNRGLEHLTFTGQISDPVWGAFPITEFEAKVLDTPEVYRLQHIKQMGLAFLDYTGLTHTRLEHSLGVMYVADQIFTILRETASQVFEQDDLVQLFNRENHQAVRLAALLHDLGHPPFSHTVELTFIRYPELLKRARDGVSESTRSPAEAAEVEPLFDEYSHEAFTRWIISHSEKLKSVLEEGFENHPGMVREIADLAVGKATERLAPFNTIISGDFDADRIDYLIRDNRHSGFSIGLSPDELNNAVHLLRERTADGQPRYEIYIDRNALHFVNSLLSARERLIQRVHLARAGRAATQMLTTFLFEDLSQIEAAKLADTIIRLHQTCTDYTFFNEIRDRMRKRVRNRYHHVADLISMPAKWKVWPHYAHLSFIRMQPSLRLMAYVSATEKYESPEDLIDHSAGLFIEPSARPAPKFSLRVDYDCCPERPSFDFIASSENRQGRSILGQSLSNLDVFAYQLDARLPDLGRKFEGGDLDKFLDDKESFLAGHVMELARRVKRKRDVDARGMFPSDFLLTLLYCLDRYIAREFPGSRAIYVFSAEAFINSFLQSVADGDGRECWHFPEEFRREQRVDANRVFSEIQRLNVFGLIETRQRPTFHIPDTPISKGTRRTRQRVYSTREDFRISHWGKHYVETEVGEELRNHIMELTRIRQGEVLPLLRKMAEAYPRESRDCSRVRVLEQFFADSAKIGWEIGEGRGCVMIFRQPSPQSEED